MPHKIRRFGDTGKRALETKRVKRRAGGKTHRIKKMAMRGSRRGRLKTWNSGGKRGPVQNLEELVVMDLVEESMGHRENSMTVQDLVLSLTESTRRLGYGFGFSMGNQMNSYGKAHIGALFGALDRLGLGKVLYYPSLEHATITSMKTKANATSLGIPVHIIEAGIIAGYLSGYLGTGIKVHETLCTYLNSDVCQFVAEPVEAQEHPSGAVNPKPKDVIKAIAERIEAVEPDKAEKGENRYYLILPNMPLMKKQLLEESSNILYLAGIELAKVHSRTSYEDALRKIACYFDMNSIEVRKLKGKRVIRINYKQYNSIEGLVELSVSMADGFLEAVFGREPKKRSGIRSNKAYFVELTV